MFSGLFGSLEMKFVLTTGALLNLLMWFLLVASDWILGLFCRKEGQKKMVELGSQEIQNMASEVFSWDFWWGQKTLVSWSFQFSYFVCNSVWCPKNLSVTWCLLAHVYACIALLKTMSPSLWFWYSALGYVGWGHSLTSTKHARLGRFVLPLPWHLWVTDRSWMHNCI